MTGTAAHAVVVVVRQRERGMGAGRGGEDIGSGDVIPGVLRNGAAAREPGVDILGLLRASGILGVLRRAAAVNEPGADILAALRANDSGAVLYCIPGKIAQEEVRWVATRAEEFHRVLVHEPSMNAGVRELPADGADEVFRSMLVHEPAMDAGRRGEGIFSVLPADDAGDEIRAHAMLVHEPGLAARRRVEGSVDVGVLPANGADANGADAVHHYKTGSTIQHLLGNGGGRVVDQDIRRVLPASNHAAFYYYYKLPNSPHEPSTGGGGRGEGLSGAMPIPKEDSGAVNYYSGMPEDKTKTAMAADVVVTFDDDVTGGLAVVAGRSKFAGDVLRGLGVAGIAAASLAVTGLAGGAAKTAAGLGVFTALLCGVTLVNLRMLAA